MTVLIVNPTTLTFIQLSKCPTKVDSMAEVLTFANSEQALLTQTVKNLVAAGYTDNKPTYEELAQFIRDLHSRRSYYRQAGVDSLGDRAESLTKRLDYV